jgi:acetyl esterase
VVEECGSARILALENDSQEHAVSFDPRLAPYVRLAAAAPPAWERTLADLRAGPDLEVPEVWGAPPVVDLVEERTIAGPGGRLRVRVYRPSASGPLPVLVWLHGGGWVVGSLDSHDPVCRHLAVTTPSVVVAPAYRLAPEDRFPAGLEDAWAALAWTVAETAALGGDPARVAVGGDSAGGNLAAVVARRARDRGLPLALQVLAYPVTDFAFDTASYGEHGTGLNLTRVKMEWYWGQYLGDADGTQEDASPLRAERLGGLAPALVQTAGFDPLRSEAEAYAARLADAGVPVTLTPYPTMIHGFLRLPALVPQALDGLAEIAAALRAPAPAVV